MDMAGMTSSHDSIQSPNAGGYDVRTETTLSPFDKELLEFDAVLSETDRLVTQLFERAAPIMLQSMPSAPPRDENAKAMDQDPDQSDRSVIRDRVRDLRIAVIGINARLDVAVDRLDV